MKMLLEDKINFSDYKLAPSYSELTKIFQYLERVDVLPNNLNF